MTKVLGSTTTYNGTEHPYLRCISKMELEWITLTNPVLCRQRGGGLGFEIMKELEPVGIHHPNSGASYPIVG